MRIDLNSPLRGAETEKSGNSSSSGRARRTQADSNSSALSEDSVTLGSLTSKALESPEVRQDKVDSLRSAVQSGQYSVDPQQVAEAMLNDAIK
ncbi:MAG TPA: flagellar biosynthesis anti-sigma factor FlgM [Terriglobales bacterium]|jgi:negative regulator of flagellin synthesis FlgM